MLSKTKILFFLLILVEVGCARVAQEFDATWIDNKTVYRKSVTLPLLEVSPELANDRK
jgi:hypothetical protein